VLLKLVLFLHKKSIIALFCSQTPGHGKNDLMEAEESARKLRVLKRTFDLLSGTAEPMSDGEYKAARMKIIQGE
jgi:hypothetical protein